MLWLIEDLQALGATVSVHLDGASPQRPQGLELLLSMERLLGHATSPSAADLIPSDSILAAADPRQSPDLVIDTTATRSADRTRTLTPYFDGVPGESGVWSALLASRAPFVEIRDSLEPNPAFAGLPAIEHPRFLNSSADQVYSRLIEALVQQARLAAGGRPAHAPAVTALPPATRSQGGASAAGFAATHISRRALAALDNLLKGAPRWQVGWRASAARRAPMAATLSIADFSVLRDDGSRFYADPFVVRHGGETHVFVEELPYATGRGLISHFTIDAAGRASPPRPVLERPHHLSYPCVFEHAGQMWMLPESPALGALELYRAERFPDRWVLEGRIIEGRLHDATIVEHQGRLWLLAASGTRKSSTWDTLSIHFADRLSGPWKPHALNPVLVDARAARPAGAMFQHDGALWRPVQDCSQGYGSALGLARITALSEHTYVQEQVGRIAFPGSSGVLGPHTLNFAGGIEVIDFFTRARG